MVNWVAYSPSDSWQPGQVAESSLVWHDLEVLQGFGFIGLATYGTLDSLCIVPRLARRLGFDYVVMGVWISEDTAANRQGIDLAIEYQADADAICVGNEALFFGRADTSYLEWAVDTIRAATGKPVTTAEHWTMYFRPGYGPWLLRNCDFLFPILNPTDNGIHDPDSGVMWVVDQLDSIKALAGESLSVLIKEAGWPTSSDSAPQRAWANETNQDVFLGQLRSWFYDTDTLYFCCEAFDGWWKNWDPTQPYWGLFDSERMPKLYAYGLGIEESSGHETGRPASPAGTFLGHSSGPVDLFDLTGQRVPAGRAKTGVYFLKTGQGRFRKTLVVR